MSAIAPDQEDDIQLFNVLTESQNSESSGDDQIPTNQNMPQQDQSTEAGSLLINPQNPSSNQGCSFWSHTISPSIQSSPPAHLYDLDDNSSTSKRPQRISGCPSAWWHGQGCFCHFGRLLRPGAWGQYSHSRPSCSSLEAKEEKEEVLRASRSGPCSPEWSSTRCPSYYEPMDEAPREGR